MNLSSSYVPGILLIVCGLIIIGAYSYLIHSVITKNAEHLPAGKWLWCYGPFLWKHIDQYRNELYNSLPLVLD